MNTHSTLKYLALLCATFFFFIPQVDAQLGKVFGKVTMDGISLPYNRVILKNGESIVKQTQSDADGNYDIARIDPGTYQLHVTAGDITRSFSLKITPGETEIKNLEVVVQTDGGIIYGAKEIFQVDPMVSHTISGPELRQMATTRRSTDALASLGNLTQADHGDPLNLRGGRQGAANSYEDGVKVVGSSALPQAAINQVTLISGGIPAEYGDLTSGVIIINTGNPGMQGWTGRPMTRAERKALRQERKRSKQGSSSKEAGQLLAYAI